MRAFLKILILKLLVKALLKIQFVWFSEKFQLKLKLISNKLLDKQLNKSAMIQYKSVWTIKQL